MSAAAGGPRIRASDAAYARLRSEIIEWTLAPGTPLGEIETSERLGVSRTPLREALSRLTAEGLVINQGRTSRVAPLARHDIVELFELREPLETQAARLAARRRSVEPFEMLRAALVENMSAAPKDGVARHYELSAVLDREIDRAIESRFLSASLQEMRGSLQRIRRVARQDRERLDQANREHLLIVDAILGSDDLLASQATAIHLHNSLANVLAHVAED